METLLNGTSIPFMGKWQMISLEGMQDTFVFGVAAWFLENQEKIKGIVLGHSTSFIPSRDSESGKSHLLFGYFSLYNT